MDQGVVKVNEDSRLPTESASIGLFLFFLSEIKCSFCRRRASNSSFGSQDGHHHHHHHHRCLVHSVVRCSRSMILTGLSICSQHILNFFRSYPIDDDNELPVFEPQSEDQAQNGHAQDQLARGSAPEADEVFWCFSNPSSSTTWKKKSASNHQQAWILRHYRFHHQSTSPLPPSTFFHHAMKNLSFLSHLISYLVHLWSPQNAHPFIFNFCAYELSFSKKAEYFLFLRFSLCQLLPYRRCILLCKFVKLMNRSCVFSFF